MVGHTSVLVRLESGRLLDSHADFMKRGESEQMWFLREELGLEDFRPVGHGATPAPNWRKRTSAALLQETSSEESAPETAAEDAPAPVFEFVGVAPGA